MPILFLMLLLLSGCAAPLPSPSQTPVPIFTPTASQTSAPPPTRTLTATVVASATRAATITLFPTYTMAFPTSTPTPYRSPTVTFTPGPPRGGMLRIFADEFDQPQLDGARWSPCYPWDKQGCTNSGNHELEWYQPDEVSIQAGILRLRAQPNPVKGSDGNDYPYTSGMVSSHGKFSLTYGFIEMRAKIPAGKGLWPAFWLLPETREWPPEIDVMEVLGHDPSTLYTTLHYKTADNPHLSTGQSSSSPRDLSQDFHSYAIDWQKDLVVWYLDGREVFRVTEQVPAQPMYLIANLAVGGDWPGSPNAATTFPAYFEIDYIHVYQ